MKVHIRWMIRRDLPECVAIERHSFAGDVWEEKDFLRCLRERNCIGMVAELGETVVGYMIYELHEGRLHLHNLAVHPDWRRRGVGRCLMAKLASKLSSHHRTRITLRCRESNLQDQQFFAACGFRAVKVHRQWFADTGEDAYCFEFRVPAEVQAA